MKLKLLLLFIIFFQGAKSQGISEKLTRIEYYQNVLEYIIVNDNLDYFSNPNNNGYNGSKKSDDERFTTIEYKLLDLDRLLVIKNNYKSDINKVMFIVSPDISNSGDVDFKTDKYIIKFLNTYCNSIIDNTKWSVGNLIFEHVKDNSGLGLLVIQKK